MMISQATHISNVTGEYYKPDPQGELNWMRWGEGQQMWYPVGTMAEGTLSPIAVPMATAQAPVAPSQYDVWPCAAPAPAPAPAPEIHDQMSAYVGLAATQLEQAKFSDYFAQYRFVGSRVTCNPPPLDTDQDVLVYVHQTNMDVVQSKLQAAGFVREGSNPAELGASIDMQSVFHSFRKGDMNYIITSDLEFYNRFSTATELARKWNLLEKSDRIQLFQAVLYGKWWA